MNFYYYYFWDFVYRYDSFEPVKATDTHLRDFDRGLYLRYVVRNIIFQSSLLDWLFYNLAGHNYVGNLKRSYQECFGS